MSPVIYAKTWKYRSLPLPFMSRHNWEVTLIQDFLHDASLYVTFNEKTFEAPLEKVKIIIDSPYSIVEVEDCDRNKYQLRKWKQDQIKAFQQELGKICRYDEDDEDCRDFLAELYRKETLD